MQNQQTAKLMMAGKDSTKDVVMKDVKTEPKEEHSPGNELTEDKGSPDGEDADDEGADDTDINIVM